MNTFINTDKALLDVPWVCRTLRAEHFGGTLTDEKIKAQIEHQLCFGLYGVPFTVDTFVFPELRGVAPTPFGRPKQIGFCSVLTDSVSLSVLGNVVIDPAYRRQGLGKLLVETAVRHPDVKKTLCLLATRDAIGFYEKLGFGQMPYFGMQHDPI